MKKLTNFLLATTLITSSASLVVSCNIGEISSKKYLSSLKDFDWSNGGQGYDLNVPIIDNNYLLDEEGIESFNTNEVVEPSFKGTYFDYDSLTTNFKESPSLLKQAVTGTPINKIYAAGNYWSDFGITSKARKNLRANTILDWNSGTDLDLKYGVSTQPLQKRTKVALKTVESQDERINFGDIRDHARSNGSYQNTNIGTRNPFEKSISNFQYREYLFDWGQHGNVSPPAADVIEAGHKNGTPVYGLMFFSGYGGLTREEMADFLKKNPDGTYKLVDILIDMALTYGFDGWFYNDETNGGWPNGTISPANFAYDLVKQFKEKTQNSTNSKAKDLKIIYYRDAGSLSTVNGTPVFGDFARMSEYADVIQTDFRVKPNDNNDYIIKNNLDRKKVHSLVELAANYQFIGNYDWRQLVYGADTSSAEGGYNKDIYQSMTSFSGEGSGNFGSQAFQIANNNVDLNDYKIRMQSFLYAQQVANMYETYMFTGLNGFLSEENTGTKSTVGTNSRYMIMADPRIDTGNSIPDEDDNVFKDLYDFKTNNGYISKSFGIGNIVQEYTIINDENLDEQNNLDINTNFSLGNGIKFLDRNSSGKIITSVNDYPWTNKRLTDILPTYTFDIKKTNENKVLPINGDISGFYDYYVPYKKGNSISIGSKLNMDGSISDAKWQTSSSYDWNIMGANLSSGNYDVSFIVKASDSSNVKKYEELINNLKIIGTYTNDGKNPTISELQTKVEELDDNWFKISSNLSAQPTNKLAKLGIRINTSSFDEFKFNVGEFNLKSKNNLETNKIEIKNIKSDVLVLRNSNKANVRFEWQDTNDFADYYQIYYKVDNKWFRVAESTLNAIFIADLPVNSNDLEFAIMPISANNDNKTLNTFKLKI